MEVHVCVDISISTNNSMPLAQNALRLAGGDRHIYTQSYPYN